MTEISYAMVAKNTDRELWREADDYYANSIHVTERGAIGINVGGTVIMRSLADWHRLAMTEARSPDVREVLLDAKETIKRADNSSGYCCCGSVVESHGLGDGHSPVDQGDYDAQHTLERIDAALAAMPVRENVEHVHIYKDGFCKICGGSLASRLGADEGRK